MSVRMEGTYLGQKKVQVTHLDSQTVITTAAPKDNNGDGSSFSPTDLFSSSLAACMLTIMGMVAERDGVDLRGSHFSVIKEMHQQPRRVGRISIEFHLPKNLTDDLRKKYENSAKTCPVHHSLHPNIEVSLSFQYDL